MEAVLTRALTKMKTAHWYGPILNRVGFFSVLLDAHMESDSADAVLTLIEGIKGDLLEAFDLPIERTFASLQASIAQAFKSEDFLSKCQYLHGETACLICAQKGKYLWWFSVGDCVVYLLIRIHLED